MLTRRFTSHSTVWAQSQIIGEYAAKPLVRITLDNLLRMAKERNILEAARHTHSQLPLRLARRVAAIQRLPYIVGVNPFISSVSDLYRNSFFRVLELDAPSDTRSVQQLADTLAELTHTHQNVIPNLARGFKECGKYMSKQAAAKFLDDMIHARIVIAEHFIALQTHLDGWMGIINTRTSPRSILNNIGQHVQELCELNYGSTPEFVLGGNVDTTFAYVPVHLDYIFMEILKNASRATVEHSQKINRLLHPPVEIDISRNETNLVIRVRDQGGGIPVQDLEKVWQYSYTTVPQSTEDDDFLAVQSRMVMQQASGGPMAGLGFGLPMSNVYAKYFGGSLEFRSMFGHGVDMFARFPNISSISEPLQI